VTAAEIKAYLARVDGEILLADGFDDALMGFGEVGGKLVAVYDRKRCIEVLMTRDSMSEEDAVEHFDFNVTGAFVGPRTPAFVTDLRSVTDPEGGL
jgi:hypothetical protein